MAKRRLRLLGIVCFLGLGACRGDLGSGEEGFSGATAAPGTSEQLDETPVDGCDADQSAKAPDVASEELSGTPEVVATVILGAHLLSPVAVGSNGWISNLGSGSVSVVDSESLEIVVTIDVGGSPRMPVVIGDHVWIPDNADGSVSVVDASSFEVLKRIALGDIVSTPAAVGRCVWIHTSNGDEPGFVSVVDGNSFEVVERIVGTGFGTPVLVGNHVWISDLLDGSVSVVDASSFEVLGVIAVGDSAGTPVQVGDQVWVPNPFDADTFDLVGTVDFSSKFGSGTQLVPVVVGDRIWISSPALGTVAVIDAESRDLVGSIAIATHPRVPVVIGGRVWISHDGDGSGLVSLVDIESLEVVDVLEIGDGPGKPAVVGDRAWVSTYDDGSVSVIGSRPLG